LVLKPFGLNIPSGLAPIGAPTLERARLQARK
jgi:hypothetical protein